MDVFFFNFLNVLYGLFVPYRMLVAYFIFNYFHPYNLAFVHYSGAGEVVEVFKGETEGGDEGFEGVRGFGVEDLEDEEGVMEYEG
ncbi:hypothetical protein RJT34_09549 [Clitoria ternatea]|uniref:Transmembrane protein n=1 Tax=Clitoria ternatea TaxID=43366 RepID=A0AAN9K7F5_CLITE